MSADTADIESLLSFPAFKTFFDAAPDAILIVDGSGCIVAHNEKARVLFAATEQSLGGLRVEQLVPTAARGRHTALRERYGAEPVTRPMGLDMQLSAQRLDGREFPVEISLAPLRIGNLRATMAIVHDITDRLKHRDTERELDQTRVIAHITQAALSEKNFERLAQVSCEAMRRILNADVVCVGVHGDRATALRLCALDSDDDTLSTDALASVLAAIATTGQTALIADAEPRPAAIGAEQVHLRSQAAVPVRGQSGLIGTLLCAAHAPQRFSRDDLAFIEVIANILSNAYQRARAEEATESARRLESIGQLTGGIAHDFNNLLTVVLGNMQLLGEAVSGNEFAARSVSAAERAAQRGAVLTRKLLAFSRRQPLQPAVIDVAKHLHACFELFDRTLGANIKVQLALAPVLPAVEIDAMQLESALLNLAVNARDAMLPAGGTLRIEARTIEHDGGALPDGSTLGAGPYVLITVSDTGAGMSADVVAHAFEPFFTTKPVGEGTGLGLAMVYGFVKQSRGHITVQSVEGQGTTFCLYFPAAEQGDAKRAQTGRTKVGTPRGHSEHILVIEDDVEVARVAEAFLLGLGYRVSVAHTGGEAFRLLDEAGDVALLLSDIVLAEGESGVQVARSLQARKPELAVLYCSGYARNELPTSVDFNDRRRFLRKPFTREQLAAAVAAALIRT